MFKELVKEANELISQNEQLLYQLDQSELQAGHYKAMFFGKRELADKLLQQNIDNFHNYFENYKIYRNLSKMHHEGLISDEEYEFLNDVRRRL